MYKKYLFLILTLFLSEIVSAHGQHVHQYIVREAYTLLKNQLGNIPVMASHISTDTGGGGGTWASGFITAGAWNEDEEDIVYGYSKTNPPAIQGGGIYDFVAIFGGITPDPFVSSTHFWDADNGNALASDLQGEMFGQPFLFTVPNAYQKILNYVYVGNNVFGCNRLFADL